MTAAPDTTRPTTDPTMTLRLAAVEAKLLTREPLTLLVSLLFPILLMVLLAGSFGSDPDPDFGGVSGVDFYVPIYSAATIAVMGLLGVPTHVAGYRQQGVLRRFTASGVSTTAVMGAQVLVTVALVATGVAGMVAIGMVGYDVSPPDDPVGVVAAYVVGTMAFAGIGLLLGAILPTARAAQGVGLLAFFGLFFIAGGGPPAPLLPAAINTVADWSPMGPLVDAVSDPWHGRGTAWTAMVVQAVMAVATFALAHWRLRRGGR